MYLDTVWIDQLTHSSQSCATHHPSIPRSLVRDEPTEWQSDDLCVRHPIRPDQFRILGLNDTRPRPSTGMNTEMIGSFESSPASLGVTVFDDHSTSTEVNIEEKHLASEDTYVGRDDGPPVDRGCQAWEYVAATLVLETVIWVSLSIFEAPLSCAHDLATLIYAGVCAVVWCFPELLHGSHFIRSGV